MLSGPGVEREIANVPGISAAWAGSAADCRCQEAGAYARPLHLMLDVLDVLLCISHRFAYIEVMAIGGPSPRVMQTLLFLLLLWNYSLYKT
jgi:hypothetical protein